MRHLFIVLFALFVPCLALAIEPANPVGEAAAGLLSGVVFPVLAALLMGLVGVVLDKLRRKYNIQISAENEQRLRDIALSGIAYAEEKAAAAVKANVSTITGKTKLDIAIARIMAAAPQLTREQADHLVHITLGRAHGAGATGNKAI